MSEWERCVQGDGRCVEDTVAIYNLASWLWRGVNNKSQTYNNVHI